MTPGPDRLSQTMRQHRQQARQVQRLDEELGLHHGLSWSELRLLDALHDAGGRLPTRQAAADTGRSAAALLRQALPMEKIGLLRRERDGSGATVWVLCTGGARRLREARETAQGVLLETSGASA